MSNEDVAVVAKELWEDTTSNDPNEDAFITCEECLELLKQSNKGFRCQLLNDTTGKCTGCVWQTSTMRDNFERFGGFVVLGAMKRELNYLLWPHMEITMQDELNMIYLVCEAILMSERKEACKALISFVCDENHSARFYNDVSVLTADGAVNHHIFAYDFQLPNAHFMEDQWYLFDLVLPNRFGETHFHSIKDDLRKTCNTNSEEERAVSFDTAMNALHSRVNRTGKPEDELNKFKN